MKLVLVQTTVADHAQAMEIAGVLVGERLCACAQVTGPVASTYRWRGDTVVEDEYLLTLKATAERCPALESRLAEIHPYELPEIVASPITASDAYAEWVGEQCK